MKTETRELLGFNVPVVGIAETLQEAISAAGSEAEVLKDLNNNVLAHSHYTILRRVIVKTLETATGVKRNGVTEGEKFTVTEKDAVYIARLEEELGTDELKTHEAAVADACSKISVDYKPGTRGSGESRAPAKKWLAYYDQLVSESKLDLFCEKHSIDGTQAEEDLKVEVANKVKEIVTARMAAAAKEAVDV